MDGDGAAGGWRTERNQSQLVPSAAQLLRSNVRLGPSQSGRIRARPFKIKLPLFLLHRLLLGGGEVLQKRLETGSSQLVQPVETWQRAVPGLDTVTAPLPPHPLQVEQILSWWTSASFQRFWGAGSPACSTAPAHVGALTRRSPPCPCASLLDRWLLLRLLGSFSRGCRGQRPGEPEAAETGSSAEAISCLLPRRLLLFDLSNANANGSGLDALTRSSSKLMRPSSSSLSSSSVAGQMRGRSSVGARRAPSALRRRCRGAGPAPGGGASCCSRLSLCFLAKLTKTWKESEG